MSTPQEDNVISAQQMCKVLNLFIQHGVTQDILQTRLLESGILSDITKVAVQGTLPDRVALQKFLSSQSVKFAHLLVPVDTVVIPARITHFLAKEEIFLAEHGRDGQAPIVYISDNFRAWFGDKTEVLFEEITLRYATLVTPSTDTSIIIELDSKEKWVIPLSAVLFLIERRNRVLLYSGRSNIFFVRDVSNQVRVVTLCWHNGGWNLSARHFGDDIMFLDGCQVFSLA